MTNIIATNFVFEQTKTKKREALKVKAKIAKNEEKKCNYVFITIHEKFRQEVKTEVKMLT